MGQKSAIVAFYEDGAEDNRGRTLEFILAQDDVWWEEVHDFIQWAFPTDERSQYNLEAPVLSVDDVRAMNASAAARGNLMRVLARARTFWGLDGTTPVRWLQSGDHNHLRITRAIRCLSVLGLRHEAQSLLEEVAAIAERRPESVSERTLDFWRRAALASV